MARGLLLIKKIAINVLWCTMLVIFFESVSIVFEIQFNDRHLKLKKK